MPGGVANAKQLALMQKVLGVYCETYGVTDEHRRDDAAATILHLFSRGTRDEETLLAELIRQRS
jgi:hypothetical protein